MLKKYIKAGKIAEEVKGLSFKIVKPGAKLVNIASAIEGKIRELGGEPAFPTNISINYVAAHRTPLADDTEVIPESSIVKVDIGVHVDGYIADTAVTIVLDDRYASMAQAAKEAVEKAVISVGPGIKFGEVGKVIEKVAKLYGFKTIKNLSGHSLGRYLIHAGDTIPNFRDPFSIGRFKVGYAYAIEPFVTNGAGMVTELKGFTQIYSLKKTKFKGLSEDEDLLLKEIMNKFKTLPFCERWLTDLISPLERLRELLTKLVAKGYLHKYPVLVEAKRGYVTQFEETVILTKDGVIVTTNSELRR